MEARCEVVFVEGADKEIVFYQFQVKLNLPDIKFCSGDKIRIEIGTQEDVRNRLVKLTERWQVFEIGHVDYFAPINEAMFAMIRFKQITIEKDFAKPTFDFLRTHGKVNGGWEWRKLGD